MNVLIVVLIVGVTVIAGTIVVRLGFGGGPRTVSAEQIVLPAGQTVTAVGEGQGTVLFVLRDGDGREALYRYSASTGEFLARVPLARE